MQSNQIERTSLGHKKKKKTWKLIFLKINSEERIVMNFIFSQLHSCLVEIDTFIGHPSNETILKTDELAF